MGIKHNRVKSDTALVRKSEAKKKHEHEKLQEIGKKYIRIPHPTLRNTFILKEKE